MAQKSKVPAKALAKAKSKDRPVAPTKKQVEARASGAKQSTKTAVKSPVTSKAKSVPQKSAAKPAAVAVKQATAKPAPKSLERKGPDAKKSGSAPHAAAKAAKPEIKKAAAVKAAPAMPPKQAAPVQAKPVATAVPPPGAAKPIAAQAPRPAAVPPAAPAMPPKAVTPPPQRTVSSAVPKPAMRSFPAPGAPPAAGIPRDIAQKAVDARQQQITSSVAAAANGPKKPVLARHGFKINESIVYPAHGVGRIVAIEEQEIAGMSLELFVIQFEKDKMTLRVPTGKLQSVGMRKLAEDDIVTKAMETLKGRARIKRTMWSRRAQEYETKINSGDLVQISEVVRDLYRSESQPEQSYSERQLYEAALDRMAREIAAVARIDERGAVQRITEVLSKSAKGRRAAEAGDADNDGAADVKAA